MHNLLTVLLSYTIINYITETLLLVSFSVRGKELSCFCARSRPKTNKNVQRRTYQVSKSVPSVNQQRLLQRRYWWCHFPLFTVDYEQSQIVLIIKRKLHDGLKIWILFSSVTNNIAVTLASSLLSFQKYCFYNSKVKFIALCHRKITSMY